MRCRILIICWNFLSWYRVTINEMLEGSDLLFQLTGKKTEPSGIAYFVSKQEREYNREWAERMHVENWIRQNWDYVRGGRIYRYSYCQ